MAETPKARSTSAAEAGDAPEKKTTTTKRATGARKAPAKKTTTSKKATTSAAKKATAKKTTRSSKQTSKSKAPVDVQEPTVAQVAAGEVHISKADKDGDHIVMTVGGKRRSLDDVDESTFNEQEEAKDEKELVEEEGFALSDSDDADEPEQQVVSAGATADPVKDYLKQIGKVALLNAVQESSSRSVSRRVCSLKKRLATRIIR